MRLAPPFPTSGDPGEWDVLTLLATTDFLEAEGEPDEGKSGVVWVIRNRVDRWKLTFHQVVLGANGRAYGDGRPYEAWSCWNDAYRAEAFKRLAKANAEVASRCWRASAGALWRLISNPVPEALFYLNVEATKRARKNHDLPDWAASPGDRTLVDPRKVVAVIAHHHFLKEAA